MTPQATAAALIAGEMPLVADIEDYWQSTDAGERPKAETAAVLAALSAAPPHADTILAFVRYVQSRYSKTALTASPEAINIVGTGGGKSTFNISTTAAFVAAAAGATVLKSGSSAYSSSVGSGDILSALGLGKALSDAHLDDMIGEVGIGFAPAGRYAPICKRLAIAAMPLPFKVIGRFVNRLGPLITPYRTRASVVGTSSETLFRIVHKVASDTGQRMLCLYSDQQVDELLPFGTNRIHWSFDNSVQDLPGAAGGNDALNLEMLRGGDLDYNVQKMTDILRGRGTALATETVALNAGAVLLAGGKAVSVEAGKSLAMEAIRSGAADEKLRAAQAFTTSRGSALEAVA